MSLSGFLLVLAAAFCHATWNYFVKRINAGPELVWLFSAVSVVLYFPLALYYGAAFFEFDSKQFFFLIGSALLHMAYFLLLQVGYRKGDLSLVYPVARSTGPLLSTCFAVLLLGEHLTIQNAIGGLIIIGGVLFLTSGGRSVMGFNRVSMGFGLAAGLFIGSYTAWDAFSVATLAIPPLILDYVSSVTRATLLAPVALKRRTSIVRIWNEHKFEVLIISVFNPLAYILVLVALTFTPVIYVAPVRELSVLLTVLAGSLLLSEGQLYHRLFWSFVIVGGVIILTGSGG